MKDAQGAPYGAIHPRWAALKQVAAASSSTMNALANKLHESIMPSIVMVTSSLSKRDNKIFATSMTTTELKKRALNGSEERAL